MTRNKTTEKKRNSVFGWKGLLADASRKTRCIVFLILLLVSSSMVFLQLGLAGIGLSERYVGYMFGLLGPIAVTALLLGKGYGFLQGLLSGVVLLIHARFQPLNLFEYYFVTPLNSYVVLSFAGFVVGLSSAIALHNDPKGIRRLLYLGIASFITVSLVTGVSIVNLVIDASMAIAKTSGSGSPVVSREMTVAIRGLGKLGLQVQCELALVFLSTVFADAVLRKYKVSGGQVSVRTTFRLWLLVVVSLVFMTVASAGFVFVTMRNEEAAYKSMSNELDYLDTQLLAKQRHLDDVLGMPELSSLSESSYAAVMDAVDAGDIIDEYEVPSDGIVVMLLNDEVYNSDSPAYPKGSRVEDVFVEEVVDSLDVLAENGEMRRTIFLERPLSDLDSLEDFMASDAQLGYVRISKVSDFYLVIMRPYSMVFAERSSTAFWSAASALVVLLVVYVLAYWLLGKVVIRPIDETNESLAKIMQGDLDEVVDVRDNTEFASLSDGVNATVTALKGWIAEAENRLERELATAKAIQESALPRSFPPFPDIDAFDLYASMNPAKEVGGDFYDFFLIDDHTLGFLIADVSGKGIPGALFMMAAKNELESRIIGSDNLAQAVSMANATLCANNDAGMFVTVWAATLNYMTGRLTYVNAGHNPPLLRHGAEGTWEWLEAKGGLFLGAFETAKYRASELVKQANDELLLYTDGVNEAFSVEEEQFGNERLEAYLELHANLHPRELVDGLRAEVAAWAEGAEQSDDITILALEYGVPPEKHK